MIRGTKRQIITPHNVDLRASIHNRFDIEVIDVNTGQIKQKAVAHNVICNQLWTYLFTKPYHYFNYIFYGNGTGTPSAADTKLFSHLGGQTAVHLRHTFDRSTGVFSLQRHTQLAAATAVGKTITEVGIAQSATTTTLCTHAMLKDMNGNLISIEKTETDVINIYATVFVHFNSAGYDNGSIFIPYYGDNGAHYASDKPDQIYNSNSGYSMDLFSWLSGTARGSSIGLFEAGDYSKYGSYGLQSGGYDFNDSDCSQYAGRFYDKVPVELTPSYDAVNRKIEISVARVEANQGNIQGLRSVALCARHKNYTSYTGCYYYPLIFLKVGGNWFSQSTVLKESIGTGDGATKKFALDFGFAKNARVYIDNVETTDFTLQYGPVVTTNWYMYMEALDEDSTPDRHLPISYFIPGKGWAADIRTRYFYNPLSHIGINSLTFNVETTVWTCDDFENWVQVGKGKTVSVGSSHRKCKYWKYTPSTAGYITGITPGTYDVKVLELATAPPEGAVITADYECDCIAKDENHVFDLTVTIQLGEYNDS